MLLVPWKQKTMRAPCLLLRLLKLAIRIVQMCDAQYWYNVYSVAWCAILSLDHSDDSDLHSKCSMLYICVFHSLRLTPQCHAFYDEVFKPAKLKLKYVQGALHQEQPHAACPSSLITGVPIS